MQRHDHRVDPAEAQEVVRLAAQRQSSPLNEGPTVEGLAEALGLTPSEVERLLAEVRSRGTATTQRRFGDRSAALSAALVLALVLVVAGVGGGAYMMFGLHKAPTVAGPAIYISDGSATTEATPSPATEDFARAAPAAPPTPPFVSEVQARELSELALQQAIVELRQEAAKAQSEANRAKIEAEIEKARAEFKKDFGKDS